MEKNEHFYAFIGQLVTIGSPNQQTGNCSMYGDIVAFLSRQDRDYYVDNYVDYDFNKIARKCNRSTARQYLLGMPMHTFNEYMQYVDLNAGEATL